MFVFAILVDHKKLSAVPTVMPHTARGLLSSQEDKHTSGEKNSHLKTEMRFYYNFTCSETFLYMKACTKGQALYSVHEGIM